MAQTGEPVFGSTNWRSWTCTWQVVDVSYKSLREDIPASVPDVAVRRAWLDLVASRRVDNLAGYIFQPLGGEMQWVEPPCYVRNLPERRLSYVTTAWRYSGHWARDPAGFMGL